MFRSFLAVASCTLVASLTIVALSTISPEGNGVDAAPALGWILFNLAYIAHFAVAGGYLTARLAQRASLPYAAALGLLFLVLGLSTARNPAPGPPVWYYPIIALIGLVSAFQGGYLRRSRQLPGINH